MVLKKNDYVDDGSISQIFTPRSVAKFMVENCSYFLDTSNFKDRNNDIHNSVKVLEPCAGQGVFLNYLIQNGYQDITAYELDINLKNVLSNRYPNVKFKFENFLGSDVEEKFDLIIGNPPYLGHNDYSKIFQNYIKKFPICAKYFVGHMDLFYYFIHLGILKLNPGGILSFITTNYWITKTEKTGIKYLKPHIVDDCYLLQYVDLTKLKLFKRATGQHNSIFVLQKKTETERKSNIDKKIEIIQIRQKKNTNLQNENFNKVIFNKLILRTTSSNIEKYYSASTNKDLNPYGNWNLLYPEDVKKIVNKIESQCMINGKLKLFKDYFRIRNGLILIKDDIFILKEGISIKFNNTDIYVKINGDYKKLNKEERNRLKKIYKSKSILPYTFKKDDYIGYLIYFNRNEFKTADIQQRNQLLEKKYPVLTAYIKQYENSLKETLINAKESSDDIYFPRRGAFIREIEEKKSNSLIDLEYLYDHGKKIFFKYISNENVFGFSESSYYATSDTYFLWPKIPEKEINYPFIISYLNSRLVKFLYKAKNISIKRSKTKLEYNLPIPNLSNFQSKQEISIINLIECLSSYLIKLYNSNFQIELNSFSKKLQDFEYFSIYKIDDLKMKILRAFMNLETDFIQDIINLLFFQLFNIDDKIIDILLEKYYI